MVWYDMKVIDREKEDDNTVLYIYFQVVLILGSRKDYYVRRSVRSSLINWSLVNRSLNKNIGIGIPNYSKKNPLLAFTPALLIFLTLLINIIQTTTAELSFEHLVPGEEPRGTVAKEKAFIKSAWMQTVKQPRRLLRKATRRAATNVLILNLRKQS